MSTFLCFICHSTVHVDTLEDIRDKYKDIVGIQLCHDSHLCHICCHLLNKFWMFKSICLKRSMEYPVLFSEKGTQNLQYSDLEINTICGLEECCSHRNINCKSYYFCSDIIKYDNYSNQSELQIDNNYLKYQKDNHYDELNFNNVVDHKIDESNNCNEVQNSVTEDSYSDDVEPDNGENDDNSSNIVKTKESTDKPELYEEESNRELDKIENEQLNYGEFNYEYLNNITENVIENLNSVNTILNSEEDEYEDVNEEKAKRKKRSANKLLSTIEEQKAQLELRRKEKKYIESEFKCYNCALGFLFKDSYQAHMMRHEESNGSHVCGVCSLRFASAGGLRKHARSHDTRERTTRRKVVVEPQACHLCARTFMNYNALQQHLKRFHHSKNSNRKYPCNVCGSMYDTPSAVRTHMIKHINRKFTCDQCPSTFCSPYSLSQHKKQHGPAAPLHYCDTCGIGYKTRKSLIGHMKNTLNHQMTLLQCPICSRMCPNQRSLASHMQTVHSSSKDFACSHCPARYTSRKSLLQHFKKHTTKNSVKTAVCHLCGRNFKGNNKLNRHLKLVCEKAKFEEQLTLLYEDEQSIVM